MPKYGANPQGNIESRMCVTCGAMFRPYRASQVTCSRPCRDRQPHKREWVQRYHADPDVRERKNAARRVENNPERRRANMRANLSRYGITLEEYEALLAKQDGYCAICGDPPDPNGRKAYSRLHVDHHHGSGNVRALLCGRCNQGLGYFLDDPERLLKAVAYLKEHT